MTSSLDSKPDSLSASEYILQNFEPSDRIAVLVRDRRAGETIQRITTAKNASPDFQAWLQHKNVASDVYIRMNALKHPSYARYTVEKAQATLQRKFGEMSTAGGETKQAIEPSRDPVEIP